MPAQYDLIEEKKIDGDTFKKVFYQGIDESGYRKNNTAIQPASEIKNNAKKIARLDNQVVIVEYKGIDTLGLAFSPRAPPDKIVYRSILNCDKRDPSGSATDGEFKSWIITSEPISEDEAEEILDEEKKNMRQKFGPRKFDEVVGNPESCEYELNNAVPLDELNSKDPVGDFYPIAKQRINNPAKNAEWNIDGEAGGLLWIDFDGRSYVYDAQYIKDNPR